MSQQDVYNAYKKIMNSPFTISLWNEELSVLNENIVYCDEKITKDVIIKGLNNFAPSIIAFMEKAIENLKLNQSVFYDLSLLFVKIKPLTFKEIVSFQEISKFIFSHEWFLCNNEILNEIIKNKHYSLFSLISENKKQVLSDNDKAKALLAILECSVEEKDDYPHEVIQYLKNNLNIQEISNNEKEMLAVGFLENKFNTYSLDFSDLKSESIKQYFNDNASAIFQYINTVIDKEIAKTEKEKDSLIFGDIFIYSQVFKDNIINLKKFCDLYIFDNENNNLMHNLCQNYSLYSIGMFISQETKDLLFEKNKYGFIPLDFVIGRRDPSELKWLEYMLNNIKTDIEGKKEILAKVGELLAKFENKSKSFRYYIKKGIELSDNEVKEIEELLDVNYVGNKEEQIKIITGIAECTKALFELNCTTPEELEIFYNDNFKIENSQFNTFVAGCAANFFYIKNKDQEKALQTYAFIISKVKSITCFEAIITNLVESSVFYEEPFDIEIKKKISSTIIMEYQKTVNGKHLDQLQNKLINAIVGYNKIIEQDEVSYEREFGRINQILFIKNNFRDLLKKIDDKTLKINIGKEEDDEDEDDIEEDLSENDSADSVSSNDSFEIYSEKSIAEFEKYSKEFKSDNKALPAWIKKLRERGGKRKLATLDSLKANIDLLRDKFPNFSEFVDFIEDGLYLNELGSNELYIPPTLLVGKPGIGKTFFLDTLAEYAKTSYEMFNMESISAGWVLKGMNGTWQDASPGLIFANAFKSDYANTMFILDEIDKSNKEKNSVENILLPLLEKYTAMNYKDEFVPVSVDLSKVIWLATANDISLLSSPVKSRFEVIEIPFPSFEERKIMTQSIYSSLLNKNAWGKAFNDTLSNTVLDVICEDANSNRDMRKNLQRAMGRCAKKTGAGENLELKEDHFNLKYQKAVDEWDIKNT